MTADPQRSASSGPPYRDYTDEPQAEPTLAPSVAAPGTGTVFVVACDSEGGWEASWQSGDAVENLRGTESEVIAWARSRPALKRVRFSRQHHDYIPL